MPAVKEITPAWREQCAAVARLWPHDGLAVALTGAGVSVPSGIPDFRSPGGLWSRYNPDRVASTWGLTHDPKAVWEFLLEAVRLFDAARPNPAHTALADLERGGRLGAVITQNIDNLHQEAGSREVIEFHGGCGRFHCMGCGLEHHPSLVRDLRPVDLPWRCGACGGLVRPDVVFFGEPIPAEALARSLDLAGRADLVLIVGTSGDVAPANTLPYTIKRNGGRVIEVNPGETSYAGLADVRLNGPAEIILPYLASLLLT